MITFKDLEQFGLGEKEARVYLASLELGAATAAEIAQKAGVKRATTYAEIELLMDMGLMSTYEHDKKTLFSAESPEALKRIIKNQEENLKSAASSLEGILPALLSMRDYAGEKPKVRFFEGKEGLNTIKDEILKVKDKKIEAFFSVDDLNQVFSMEEIKKYFERRLAKKIQMKGMYTRAKGPFTDIAKGDEIRIIPRDKFPLSVDVTIFSDRVALSSLKGKLMGVIIESKEIAETFRSIFNLAWEAAKKQMNICGNTGEKIFLKFL